MRLILRACCTALAAVVLHLPGVQAQEIETEVGMWDRFETSISNTRTYASPYTGVDLDVVYTRPDGSTFAFWGFYDGGTTWRARMMCDDLGQWQYTATFSDGQPGKRGSFTCVPSDIPGMLSQDETNPRWLGFKGGGHALIRSFHVGDRFFASNWSSSSRTQFLNWARQQGYNMLSIASHGPKWMKEGRGEGWNTPVLWPLNAAEYRRMETIMDLLADQRMMIYPFAGFFGKLQSNVPQSASDQEAYVRYTMARIGPYWNLVMNVMGAEMNRHPSVNRLGALVQRYNVFDHPLGLHPFDDEYRQISQQAWSSVVVVQGLEGSTSNLPVFLDRMYNGLVGAYVPGKPVYAHETFWPGNTLQPDYSSAETVRKVGWITLMAGATLNYGDMDGNSSSGFSGTMNLDQKVQSRHDIMKRIWDFFEALPFQRMNPMPGLVNNGYCLAQPGREYLVYLTQPGTVDVRVTGGPYQATWINAANTQDRRNAGSTADGRGLTTPSGGADWLLHLVGGDEVGPPGSPVVAFSDLGQSVNEGSGRVTISVELSHASDQMIEVPLQIEGTAVAGADYATTDDRIRIAAGETSGQLVVELIDDAAVEAGKDLSFSLGEPTNAIPGSPSLHRLSIIDDDSGPSSEPPQVSFVTDRSSSDESSKKQRMTLRLSRPSDFTIIVPIQYRGSAVRNRDYKAYDNVTFSPGTVERPLGVNLLEDRERESAETIVITLGTPANAGLGAIAAHTKTIVDND
ncbi:MAG: Calx-beta domain-containing protein [Panacagrimonas sp.]